jgi:hypothetical protein
VLESVIDIIGFCLAVATALVLVSKAERKVTFGITFALLLVFVTGYWGYERWEHRRYIRYVADAITRTFSTNKAQSLEQIADRVNENRSDPVTHADLEEAIEEERKKGYVCSGNLNVTDPNGQPYVIRVYKDVNFGC